MDKMLINYFDSSSILSIYQKNFKKVMIEKIVQILVIITLSTLRP